VKLVIFRSLPWLWPGLLLTSLVGLVSARKVSRYLRIQPAAAFLMAFGLGLVVFATLTPRRVAIEYGAVGTGVCDMSQVWPSSARLWMASKDRPLNVLLFIPLGLAIALVPRSPAKIALIVAAALMPFGIELVQRVAPVLARSCQGGDVADNLSGLVLGLVAGVMASRFASSRRSRLAKRLFDVLVAGAALVVLLPVLIVVAGLVRTRLGTPVLFRQIRPGLHGRLFTIYKFRTMTDARDANGTLRPDAERLTAFGQLLRATSVDELPELVNVLRGDMSLVGPRPLMVDYLPLYSAEQARRHDVLPGITGWAQINGRNAMSWPEKFACDVWYVDHGSLWLDMKILLLTCWSVATRRGINQPGYATASVFRGAKSKPG
jgi:lipopolysaccharide/colanic/teichoic acid biosynthesis glycosyltransferase